MLFLVPGFPANEADTSCLPALQNYVRAFRRLHPEIAVEVIAFEYPPRQELYSWHGVSVLAAGGGNRGGIRKLQTWGRVLRHLQPARLIHSFWIGECALVGEWLSRRSGCAHVASIGGQELRRHTPYSRLLRMGRFLLTAGSQQAAATAPPALGRGVDAVIPLGIDLEHLPQFHAGNAERDVDILAVGSLIPIKRFDLVMDVAASLPDASVVVAGEGPLRHELSLSAPANVTLTGSLPREEILRLMHRSKVLLHPSEYESQGYVFLEALASGMHVVCRDVGSPGTSPKVHRVDSKDEMTTAVTQILTSPRDYAPVPVMTAADSVRAFESVYAAAVNIKI